MENYYYTSSYKLYSVDKDGVETLREETSKERPYQFITGLGLQLDAFENALADKKTGDTFDFTIPVAEAQGEHDKEKVIAQPRSLFEIDGKFDEEQIFAGAIITLMDEEQHRFPATIVKVTDTEVVVDLNAPFAGYDLRFVGEVIEKRVATDEEVDGVIQMLQGECSCGCNHDDCSGCGGGCS